MINSNFCETSQKIPKKQKSAITEKLSKMLDHNQKF